MGRKDEIDIFDGVPKGVARTIRETMVTAAGAGVPGAFVPIVDMAAITALWARMLYKIGQAHRVTLKDDECVKIITACGGSITAYLGGSKLLNFLLSLTGVGIPVAVAGNAAFNGYYSYAVGMAFHKMLETDGINGRTAWEISKLLLKYFVPIPSLGTLKNCVKLIKGEVS